MIKKNTNQKNKSLDSFLKKTTNLLTLIFLFIVLIFFWKAKNNANKNEINKSDIEKKISFSGTISKYKTDIFAEKSTFIIDDSISITIPRNSKELFLNNGDEITKTKGNNFYIVKRNTLLNNESKKVVDTFNFK